MKEAGAGLCRRDGWECGTEVLKLCDVSCCGGCLPKVVELAHSDKVRLLASKPLAECSLEVLP